MKSQKVESEFYFIKKGCWMHKSLKFDVHRLDKPYFGRLHFEVCHVDSGTKYICPNFRDVMEYCR